MRRRAPKRACTSSTCGQRDLATVTLMLLQGITRLDRALGHRQARELLATEAVAIRAALPAASLTGLEVTVDLAASGFRQLGYSSSCVVARRYELATLPGRWDSGRILPASCP